MADRSPSVAIGCLLHRADVCAAKRARAGPARAFRSRLVVATPPNWPVRSHSVRSPLEHERARVDTLDAQRASGGPRQGELCQLLTNLIGQHGEPAEDVQ